VVQEYLGLRHDYGVIDCIELIRLFYKQELNVNFPLPTYPKSKEWMKHFSTESVDQWASSCSIKVKLTDAQNYDVMAFKSTKSNLIIHFGLFLAPTRMLHIEEGGVSHVETLSDYWVKQIHSLYRHEKMV
jgi:cell wall-associated NlpC family hydrolase|tara:strand:- start:459 stop:848 length:390 start_codon:yes stop_codon:yes gene_type:complete